ncbi:hypothetical protein RND71_004136 [Anisodus tanguticus]|uniref:COP9 signalosome complex subunit 2 n=1 Tax=Anisodus tanguticus TaxID=243964 RepID=A0AAE1SY03_9SOLA|nr:hypothetical protein RND71_004136 [Anisodus tanguticus]
MSHIEQLMPMIPVSNPKATGIRIVDPTSPNPRLYTLGYSLEEIWGSASNDNMLGPAYGVKSIRSKKKDWNINLIENLRATNKPLGLVETDPEGALEGFVEVVRMEPEKAEWGFKDLKQTVKIHYRLGRYKEMMDAYREMLTYIKSAVTQNYSENALAQLRLWFKTNLKLCKIWFDLGEYGKMSKILKELHRSCQKADGTDDGTQLLEVYAIEIQMYTETKNNKKLKALTIKSAVPHPRIMGIIRECGGKMHMAQRQWAEAATDFFEAFKNYDEAGNHRHIQCLNKIVFQELNVPEDDVETLLVSLILDNRIQGHIDQVNKLLERSDRSKGMKKYTAIDKWNTQFHSLYQTISNRVG